MPTSDICVVVDEINPTSIGSMSSVERKKINLFPLNTSWKGQFKDRHPTAGINAHRVSYPLAHLRPGLSFKNQGRYFMKSFSFGLPWMDFPIGHPIHTEELSEKKIYTSALLVDLHIPDHNPLAFTLSQLNIHLSTLLLHQALSGTECLKTNGIRLYSWWLFIDFLGTPYP